MGRGDRPGGGEVRQVIGKKWRTIVVGRSLKIGIDQRANRACFRTLASNRRGRAFKHFLFQFWTGHQPPGRDFLSDRDVLSALVGHARMEDRFRAIGVECFFSLPIAPFAGHFSRLLLSPFCFVPFLFFSWRGRALCLVRRPITAITAGETQPPGCGSSQKGKKKKARLSLCIFFRFPCLCRCACRPSAALATIQPRAHIDRQADTRDRQRIDREKEREERRHGATSWDSA